VQPATAQLATCNEKPVFGQNAGSKLAQRATGATDEKVKQVE
jgi:hypothetical protein